MTLQHLGLLCSIIGAVFLAALATQTRGLYEGEAARAVAEAKKRNPGLIEPTETRTAWPYVLGGLLLVAVGTLLQW